MNAATRPLATARRSALHRVLPLLAAGLAGLCAATAPAHASSWTYYPGSICQTNGTSTVLTNGGRDNRTPPGTGPVAQATVFMCPLPVQDPPLYGGPLQVTVHYASNTRTDVSSTCTLRYLLSSHENTGSAQTLTLPAGTIPVDGRMIGYSTLEVQMPNTSGLGLPWPFPSNLYLRCSLTNSTAAPYSAILAISVRRPDL